MRRIYTLLSLSLLLGSLLLFSACNDCTTRVAQFENGDGSWVVYKAGDTLRMRDERDSSYIFVNTRVSSDPIPGDGFEVSDACIEQYYTRRASVMQESRRRAPGLTVIAVRRPEDVRVSLVAVNRGELQIPDINSPQFAQQEVNGISYNNVFEVVNTEESPDGIKRVLFNREFGILQVEYFAGTTSHGRILRRTQR